MSKAWLHFKTITYHKYLVMKGCFKVGLYKQGLMHDLSKYSPTEFLVGARYYQGDRSPNNAEREDIGYSSAWLHHKGRNKHHYEYWIDYSSRDIPGGMAPASMPNKYIIEMLMDRIAACKVYHGADYTDSDPLAYYERGRELSIMHEKTKKKLEFLLRMLADRGEDYTFRYIRRHILKNGR
ncbi:MAG: catalase [Lachnospiraceae bacterium]|nr:catalase [Lachnospiraceae bacterium]